MDFALVLLGTVTLAIIVGLAVHRRWIIPTAIVVGIGVVAIDISTRNLAAGGHDWTVVVAIGELLIVVLVAVGLACGIALSNRRSHSASD